MSNFAPAIRNLWKWKTPAHEAESVGNIRYTAGTPGAIRRFSQAGPAILSHLTRSAPFASRCLVTQYNSGSI